MALFDPTVALEAFEYYRKGTDINYSFVSIIREKLESAATNKDWDYLFEIIVEDFPSLDKMKLKDKALKIQDYIVGFGVDDKHEASYDIGFEPDYYGPGQFLFIKAHGRYGVVFNLVTN